MPDIKFRSLFTVVIGFLVKEKIEYVLIGGVASDIWGRPRKTLDIDIVIHVPPDKYNDFLSKTGKYKFTFKSKTALKQLQTMGMCRFYYGSYHADFIMGYSEFEESIFKRKRKVKIFGKQVFVASPEDIILYKLVSYRPIDQTDVSNIILAQGAKLDKAYLVKRAVQMQKDLLRPDIKKNLERILGLSH
jgi:hypothetical protein